MKWPYLELEASVSIVVWFLFIASVCNCCGVMRNRLNSFVANGVHKQNESSNEQDAVGLHADFVSMNTSSIAISL